MLGWRTIYFSSPKRAREYFKQEIPTIEPPKAAALILRLPLRCTLGGSAAELYSEGPKAVKPEGVLLCALSIGEVRSALAQPVDKR